MSGISVGELEAIFRLRDEISAQLEKIRAGFANFVKGATESGKSLQTWGTNAAVAGAALTTITGRLQAVAQESIAMAMDTIESENLVKEAFGGMLGEANSWSKAMADAYGLNEFALRKSAGTMFVMADAMGLNKQQAFELSTGVVELAQDFASFYNLSGDEAFAKISSGLRGEAEPLRALGVLLDENTVKQAAYANGIAKLGSELTQSEKVQARWVAITQQAAKASGDLARTIESPTNQMRLMSAQVDSLKIQFGNALLPLWGSVLSVGKEMFPMLQTLVGWFTSLDTTTKTIIVTIFSLLAALGPMLITVGGLVGAWGAALPVFASAATGFVTLVTSATPVGPILLAIAAAIFILDGDTSDLIDIWNYLKAGFSELADENGPAVRGALQGISDVVKDVTGGIVDMSAAVKNSNMFVDAMKVVWNSTKALFADVGIGILKVAAAIEGIAGNDKMIAQHNESIRLLEDWKLAAADAAIAITNKTEVEKAAAPAVAATTKAVQENTRAIIPSNKELKEAERAAKLAAKAREEYSKALNDNMKALVAEHNALRALLGPGVAEVTAQMDRLVASVGEFGGGLQELTDSQLAKLITEMQKLALEGGESEEGIKLLAAAMEEAGTRGDSMNVKIGMVAKTVEETGTKTTEAAKKTIDWAKGLDILKDVFQTLGVSADNFIMKAVVGFQAGKAAAAEMQKVLKDPEATEQQKQMAVGLGAANTAMVAYKSGALGGAAAGAAFGSSFGPIGTAVGALAGGILGLFGKKKALEEQMKKNRAEFIASMGGLDALTATAKIAGVSLDELFKAKNAEQLKKAIADVQNGLANWNEAQQLLNDTMEKYGIQINDLGPKFRQQELDKQAAQLYKEWQILVGAGVDVNLIIEKMGPNFMSYVNTSIAGGTEIQKSLKPVIDQMFQQGKLLHENGVAYTQAEYEAIRYGSTQSEMFDTLIKKIGDLVAALTGIPNIERTVNVNTNYTESGDGDGGKSQSKKVDIYAASGWAGIVGPGHGGSKIISAGEGGEAELAQITPLSKLRSGSAGGGMDAVVAELQALRRELPTSVRDAVLKTGR